MGHVQMASRIASVLSPLALVTLTAIVGSNFQTSAIAQSAQAPLFQPAVAYDAGGYITNAVVAADIDGDGRLDLVSANSFACAYPVCSEGNVGVLLGRGRDVSAASHIRFWRSADEGCRRRRRE